MSLPAKSIATMSLAALLCAGATLSAAAEDRCSGTLCDLYYGAGGGDSKPQPAPAGATPVTVPTGGILGFLARPAPTAAGTTAAPASAPRVAIEGGGLVGKLNGAPEERCTGTICDLFYGGPPPEHAASAAASAPSSAGVTLAPAQAPQPPQGLAPAAWPEETAVRYRETRDVEREPKPHCAAPANDPWRCYR